MTKMALSGEVKGRLVLNEKTTLGSFHDELLERNSNEFIGCSSALRNRGYVRTF
jgi:hypothetical protein